MALMVKPYAAANAFTLFLLNIHQPSSGGAFPACVLKTEHSTQNALKVLLILPLYSRYFKNFVLVTEQTEPKLPKSNWRQLAHLLDAEESPLIRPALVSV
jgi:hypothetical protein